MCGGVLPIASVSERSGVFGDGEGVWKDCEKRLPVLKRIRRGREEEGEESHRHRG